MENNMGNAIESTTEHRACPGHPLILSLLTRRDWHVWVEDLGSCVEECQVFLACGWLSN